MRRATRESRALLLLLLSMRSWPALGSDGWGRCLAGPPRSPVLCTPPWLCPTGLITLTTLS